MKQNKNPNDNFLPILVGMALILVGAMGYIFYNYHTMNNDYEVWAVPEGYFKEGIYD